MNDKARTVYLMQPPHWGDSIIRSIQSIDSEARTRLCASLFYFSAHGPLTTRGK
jgi:hypothetical protein